MASISIDNFTVTIASFTATAGDDFTIANPSVVLLLTPNTGYTIIAGNFSPVNPLPSYVSSVVFSQNGTDINCVVNYISPSIMPAADILIAICASGYAEQTPVTISGEVKDCGISNVSQPVGLPIAYNGSGNYGTSAVVSTSTVVASAGYYFEVVPVLWLSVGVRSNYTITNTKTYNASNQLIQIVFTVTYTFPAGNVVGDELCLTANALPLYAPSIEIQSYQFNSSTIPVSGTSRNFTIYGITGANWTLTAVANVGSVTILDTSGVIDSTGQNVIDITFPLTTANQSYTFTLTGDLSPLFDTPSGQSSTITVYQYVNTTLSFAFTSSNSDVTVGAAVSRSFIPYGPATLIYTYNVTATSTVDIVLLSALPNAGWTDQSLEAPFYDQNVISSVVEIDNTDPIAKTLSATLGVTINFAGTTNLLSTLDLNQYIQSSLTPISLFYGTNPTDVCCTGTVGDYFVNSGETFLTALAILNASGGAAADGYYSEGTNYRQQTGGTLGADSVCAPPVYYELAGCVASGFAYVLV